ARSRRRVRLREVDHGLLHPAAAQADRGLGSLPPAGADEDAPGRAPEDAPRDADRLPGPLRVAEPADDRRRHRRRATRRPRDRRHRAGRGGLHEPEESVHAGAPSRGAGPGSAEDARPARRAAEAQGRSRRTAVRIVAVAVAALAVAAGPGAAVYSAVAKNADV